MPLEWPERARLELIGPASQLALTSEVDEANAAPVGDRGAANANVGDEIVVVDLQAVMVFSTARPLGAGSAAYPTNVIVPTTCSPMVTIRDLPQAPGLLLYSAAAAGFGSVGAAL